MNTSLAIAALGLLAAGCGPEGASESADEDTLELEQQELWFRLHSGEVILDWNEHAAAALTTHDGYADPVVATRVMTMVHLAMHDAINATGYQFFETYAYSGRDRVAHPVAAAAAAAHRVLVSLFPEQQGALQAQLELSLASVPNGLSERRGVRLGSRVGSALFALRQDDGSGKSVPYTPGVAPGDYQFTTPGFIYKPGWQNVEPWALDSSSQFRPGPPPALASAAYTEDFEELKNKGNLGPNTRSADETSYAQFWYEFSDIGWNRVARVVVQDQALGLAQAARLFALVHMAMADSYIAGWDAKFFYDFWRPVTALRAADLDGNPDTAPQPSWESFLLTPPVQDYPSTHSTLGAAAAEILTRYFGRRGDSIGFSMTSSSASDPNQEVRSFQSFAQAALENADSRVMAGLHFRFSCEAGLELGQEIGAYVFKHQLRPKRHWLRSR